MQINRHLFHTRQINRYICTYGTNKDHIVKHIFNKLLTTLVVLLPLTLWAQAKVTVTGTISSDTEGALIGASVVSGPTSGVSTDIEGRY